MLWCTTHRDGVTEGRETGSLEDRAKELAAQRQRERAAAEERRREEAAEAARRAEQAYRPFEQAAREFVALVRQYGIQPFLYGNLYYQGVLQRERGLPVWVVTPYVDRGMGSTRDGVAVDAEGRAYYFMPSYAGGEVTLQPPTYKPYSGSGNPYAHGFKLEHWERWLEVAASHIVEGDPLPPAVRER